MRGKAVGGSVEGFQRGLVRVGRRRTEVSDGREGIRCHCFSIHRCSLLPDVLCCPMLQLLMVSRRGEGEGGGGKEARGGARKQEGQEEEQGNKTDKRKEGREGCEVLRSGSTGSGVNRLRIKVGPGLIYCHHGPFDVGAGQRKRGRHSTRTIVCGRYGRVASSYSRGRQKLTPTKNDNALHVNCCWRPGR